MLTQKITRFPPLWDASTFDMKYLTKNLRKKISRILPDKLYLKIQYFRRFRKRLNLKNPQTFNEKLNWEKLYDHNPIYTLMADKYEVKKYVAGLIGEKYVVPCFGVWNHFDEIDFEKLPNQFVLKATHDSSGATICRDKATFNFSECRKKFNTIMKRNWYYSSREWAYKDIQPRIIADLFLDDGTGKELKDYKFWCFSGIPKVIYCTNKGKNIYENFYDMEFNPLDIDHGFKRNIPVL